MIICFCLPRLFNQSWVNFPLFNLLVQSASESVRSRSDISSEMVLSAWCMRHHSQQGSGGHFSLGSSGWWWERETLEARLELNISLWALSPQCSRRENQSHLGSSCLFYGMLARGGGGVPGKVGARTPSLPGLRTGGKCPSHEQTYMQPPVLMRVYRGLRGK